jgi:hypothetical protein
MKKKVILKMSDEELLKRLEDEKKKDWRDLPLKDWRKQSSDEYAKERIECDLQWEKEKFEIGLDLTKKELKKIYYEKKYPTLDDITVEDLSNPVEYQNPYWEPSSPTMKDWWWKENTPERAVKENNEKIERINLEKEIRKSVREEFQDEIHNLKTKLKEQVERNLALRHELVEKDKLKKENKKLKEKLDLIENRPEEYKRLKTLDPYDEENWDK